MSDWEKRVASFLRGKPQCMYARKEGPHRVACLKAANFRDEEGCPVCANHTRVAKVRFGWIGFVEGADRAAVTPTEVRES